MFFLPLLLIFAVLGFAFYAFSRKNPEIDEKKTTITYLFKKRKRLQRRWKVLKYTLGKKTKRYQLSSASFHKKIAVNTKPLDK
ncbi:MAG: hypothetical protein K1X55_14450 [Chitinophagales bacterium]|nr:hypothetical protein [Chitinophagales bacterium]